MWSTWCKAEAKNVFRIYSIVKEPFTPASLGIVPFPIQSTEFLPQLGLETISNSKPSPANLSNTTPASSDQNNAFDDDVERIDEEDDSNSADSSKPGAIDNEAIEELVNRFLNSDTAEDGKEEKLNKEALKLINSSKYWDVNNLEPEGSIRDGKKAQEWMNGYTVEAQKVLREVALAGWNYVTSVSHLTKQLLDEAEEILGKFVKSSSKQAKQFDIAAIEDKSLKRQFELLLVEGINALDENDFNEYNELQKLIAKTYAETSVCETDNTTICPYRVSDIVSIIAHENDGPKALRLWTALRNALGPKLVTSYKRLIELINKGAKLNGFSDGGAMWRSPYELFASRHEKAAQSDIVALLQKLYQQINPFYKQLHAHVRRQIPALYGLRNVSGLTRDGPIPAHLLKSIACDSWVPFYWDTKPFQDEDDVAKEVQENFQKLNYTVKNMFKQAYKTLKQLGFDKLPSSFWTKSIFTRTWSKDMLCHPPAAYDMRDQHDYRYSFCQPKERKGQPFCNLVTLRVKACAHLNLPDFELTHKLLVHVYYYYLCRDQPLLFREATNPSFLSAMTNAFAINARNMEYLKMMKLITSETGFSRSKIINRLYLEALEDFVKLPFDFAVDMWRFHIFDGTSTNATWNSDWWQLRQAIYSKEEAKVNIESELFQGIKAPVERKSTDFDTIAFSAIAQTHAPAMKHFFAYIMQFQILKALCRGTTNLSNGCMLENSPVIDKIKKVMAFGSSITWREALEIITGSREVDANAMLEYYQPLISWLEEQNAKEQVYIGWDGIGKPFAEYHFLSSFDGGDCSNGKECLLDSVCRNDICECKEGLYTLKIGNTYNCVPGNPADAGKASFRGFGDGHGGLVIGLHPIDDGSVVSIPEPEEHENQLNAESESGIAKDKPSSLSEPEPKPKGTSISIPTLTLMLPLTALIVLL
ncbi:dipeptidyl carboxydipeptidase family protein [Onchocerca flexuosa]|uniref:Dipeptidyl carboxydipeptidase family protein n=1 Tax=Onchocerca flexuosa TaxID=387005 RepID=A0A238C0X7_9BILA|nr:dipeptidyl carboxydipeptidase family protein [Onchocerca flexuosa]